jgi:hypothetical protein
MINNKFLFYILIISIIVLSCTRNGNSITPKKNDVNLISVDDHQEEIFIIEQEQYDDENDFIIETFPYETGVYITDYRGSKHEIRIPPRIKDMPVEVIGDNAFRNKQITSITFPNSVLSIGDHAFEKNELSSVIIPNSVRHIGDHAFEENELSSVIIPNGIRHIGDWAFRGNKLTELNIPDSVSYIGLRAFNGNLLTNVTIGSGIKEIEGRAFSENQITSLTIAENNHILHIGSSAFADNQLTSITIPGFVSFDDDSFPAGFYSFYYKKGREYLPNKTTGTYTWDGENWNVVLSPYDHAMNFKITVINNTAVSIKEYKLTSEINIPREIRKTVSIPPQIDGLPVTTIEDIAFMAGDLTSVIIPDSVIFIGGSAFAYNEITNLELRNSKLILSDRAFENNKITSLIINTETIGVMAFQLNQLENVVFGENVITIEDSAFEENKIARVIIPGNITDIRRRAFFGNPITSITVPGNISIGDRAFPNNFSNFYNSNGKRAGTYTWNGIDWSVLFTDTYIEKSTTPP